MRQPKFKPGDRVYYIGKKDQRYGCESLWGKLLTVVTVHKDYLSADTPPMGYRPDGYRTTWIDFEDVAIAGEDELCAA